MLFFLLLLHIAFAVVSNILLVDSFITTAFLPRRAHFIDKVHLSPPASFFNSERRFSTRLIVTHTASLLPETDIDAKRQEKEADDDAVNVVLVTGFESFNR